MEGSEEERRGCEGEKEERTLEGGRRDERRTHRENFEGLWWFEGKDFLP